VKEHIQAKMNIAWMILSGRPVGRTKKAI